MDLSQLYFDKWSWMSVNMNSFCLRLGLKVFVAELSGWKLTNHFNKSHKFYCVRKLWIQTNEKEILSLAWTVNYFEVHLLI